jgi:hypothetical protein
VVEQLRTKVLVVRRPAFALFVDEGIRQELARDERLELQNECDLPLFAASLQKVPVGLAAVLETCLDGREDVEDVSLAHPQQSTAIMARDGEEQIRRGKEADVEHRLEFILASEDVITGVAICEHRCRRVKRQCTASTSGVPAGKPLDAFLLPGEGV